MDEIEDRGLEPSQPVLLVFRMVCAEYGETETVTASLWFKIESKEDGVCTGYCLDSEPLILNSSAHNHLDATFLNQTVASVGLNLGA